MSKLMTKTTRDKKTHPCLKVEHIKKKTNVESITSGRPQF